MSSTDYLGKNSNFALGKNFKILDSHNKSKSEPNPQSKIPGELWILCPVHFKAVTFIFWLHTAQIGWPSQKEMDRINFQGLQLSGTSLMPTVDMTSLSPQMFPFPDSKQC